MAHHLKGKRYKTQDICKIFDISKATLFRWEKEGLISNVGRDWRNWRLYSEQNMKEIRRIMHSRNNRP
ncbi:MAG: MerR family transcriptional regulator [Nitrospirae bacterium]|nr:MerR family transcriptional regulator [Nitrospirota bacterium]